MTEDGAESSAGAYRAPREELSHWPPESPYPDFERRVCPNCRNYFDAHEDSDAVFCGDACRRRHERGEFCA